MYMAQFIIIFTHDGKGNAVGKKVKKDARLFAGAVGFRSGQATIEASFFASFAFLLDALFLWMIPLVTAESMAETVSG